MNNRNVYNVLWFEDEPEKNKAFVEECEDLGIILHNVKVRQIGISEFERKFDMWDAVLLDAEMPEESENEVADIYGLPQMEQLIASYRKKRDVPVFISTGKDDLKNSRGFIKSHSTEVYVKGLHIKKDGKVIMKGDDELLEDMLEAMGNSPTRQIKTKYDDVFRTMDRLGFVDHAKEILIQILLPLHFPYDYSQFSPLLHYNQLRQFIEYFFRVCNKCGFVPNQCIPNGIVNLNQSSLYLAGKNCDVLKIRYGEPGERVAPEYIENILVDVLELGNTHSHTTKMDSGDEAKIDSFFRTCNSRFLIFGFALHMCELVSWLEGHFALNDNVQCNLSKCRSVVMISEYEGKEFTVEQDEKGNFHCDKCLLHKSSASYLGKKVTLKNVTNNTSSTKNRYPYYSQFDPIDQK